MLSFLMIISYVCLGKCCSVMRRRESRPSRTQLARNYSVIIDSVRIILDINIPMTRAMSSNCRAMKKQTHIPKADESSPEIRAQRGVSSRSRKLREIAASISGCRWTSSGHRSDIALSLSLSEELAGAHSRVGTRGDREPASAAARCAANLA